VPKRNLELTITRKGHKQDVIDLFADPDDVGALERALRGWLEGNKWAQGLWPQFAAEVRVDGAYKVARKVVP
jgi:hypothetical protein